MRRTEFIRILKSQLKSVQKEEMKEIIEDYEEHFEEGIKKGRTESDLVKSLGDPKTIAKQIKVDYNVKIAEGDKTTKNIIKAILASAGLGFFNLIFVLGPFLAIVGVLIGLFATSIGITFGGIALFVASIIGPINPYVNISGPNVFAGIFFAIGLISLGLLFLIISCAFTKWIYSITLKYLKWNIELIKGKEEEK